MAVSRRRLFQAAALAGGSATAPVDALRNVAEAHGRNLSDDRLRIVKPVLEQRQAQIRALREFEVDDSIAPTQGILMDRHG